MCRQRSLLAALRRRQANVGEAAALAARASARSALLAGLARYACSRLAFSTRFRPVGGGVGVTGRACAGAGVAAGLGLFVAAGVRVRVAAGLGLVVAAGVRVRVAAGLGLVVAAGVRVRVAAG